MAELPQNWQKEYLTNICNVYQPKTISTKELLADGSYPVYGANGQIGYYDKYNHEFSEVLITCRGATCGNINKSVPKSWINGNAMVASPISNAILDKNYLFYYLKNTSFDDYISGTAQPQITRTSLTKMPVIYPPLNEQKRIVEKLDKIMRIVEDVNERLDKIPTALKRARQSILNQAITGELTKDWRENRGLNMSWENVILIDLLQEKPRNGYSPISVNYDTGIKNLTLTATTSGVFKKEYYKFVDIKIDKNSHLWLSDGDILIQRSNSIDYVGTAAIYHGNQFEYIYPDLMMKLKVNERVSNEYLYLCLSSINVKNYFRNNATGTAGNMPKINQKVVSNTPITLPPKEEQTEIVRRVKLAFEKLDKIELRYQKAKEYSDKLTQSILNKAFRGELVPQDPNDSPIKIPE